MSVGDGGIGMCEGVKGVGTDGCRRRGGRLGLLRLRSNVTVRFSEELETFGTGSTNGHPSTLSTIRLQGSIVISLSSSRTPA
jgi:hypothetical protein